MLRRSIRSSSYRTHGIRSHERNRVLDFLSIYLSIYHITRRNSLSYICMCTYRLYLVGERKKLGGIMRRWPSLGMYVSFLPSFLPSFLTLVQKRFRSSRRKRGRSTVTTVFSLRTIHHHRVQREQRAALSASNRASCFATFMLDSSWFYRTLIPSRFILRPRRASHLFPPFFFFFLLRLPLLFFALSLSLYGVISSRFFRIFDIECSDALAYFIHVHKYRDIFLRAKRVTCVTLTRSTFPYYIFSKRFRI